MVGSAPLKVNFAGALLGVIIILTQSVLANALPLDLWSKKKMNFFLVGQINLPSGDNRRPTGWPCDGTYLSTKINRCYAFR